jgi:hypothetical protein
MIALDSRQRNTLLGFDIKSELVLSDPRQKFSMITSGCLRGYRINEFVDCPIAPSQTPEHRELGRHLQIL